MGRATSLILAICFMSYFLVSLLQLYGVEQEELLVNLAFSKPNLLLRPYTLLTSIFLHLDLTHLLANAFAILFFGRTLEKRIGSAKLLLLFLLGGIIANLVSLFFYSSEFYFLGSSGGAFALLGAAMLLTPLEIEIYPFPAPIVLIALLYALYNAIGFFYGPSNISYVGHFAGMSIGILYGMRRAGIRQTLFVLLIVILLLIPLLFLFLS